MNWPEMGSILPLRHGKGAGHAPARILHARGCRSTAAVDRRAARIEINHNPSTIQPVGALRQLHIAEQSYQITIKIVDCRLADRLW
jgi:hypothetical protein